MACWYFIFWEQIQQQLLTDLFYHLSTNIVPKIWAREREARCRACTIIVQFYMLVTEHWLTNCKEPFIIMSVPEVVVIESLTHIKAAKIWDPFPNLQWICLFIIHWVSSIPVFCGDLYIGPSWAMCYVCKLHHVTVPPLPSFSVCWTVCVLAKLYCQLLINVKNYLFHIF